MAKVNVIREIFSGENGKLSSKRVIGGIAMAVGLICTIVLVARDGSTQVVENLLQTIFIISTTLLGVANVTGIWKNNKIEVGEQKEETVIVQQPNNKEEPEFFDIGDGAFPGVNNCDTCEYKLKCMEIEKGTE